MDEQLISEIHAKRLERFKRRQLRHEAEARKQAAIDSAKCVAEFIVLVLMVYGMLFFGCLWASM